MATFIYNNTKNISTSYAFFELNCGFYPRASYKKYINPCFNSKFTNQLIKKVKDLIVNYRKNLKYALKT